MKKEELLNWLEKWFFNQCNGNWEHLEGIKISTLDNPGWDIKIQLEGTELEGIIQKLIMVHNSDKDWYGMKIENNIFEAFGDPSKLEFLLITFKEIVEKNYKTAD